MERSYMDLEKRRAGVQGVGRKIGAIDGGGGNGVGVLCGQVRTRGTESGGDDLDGIAQVMVRKENLVGSGQVEVEGELRNLMTNNVRGATERDGLLRTRMTKLDGSDIGRRMM
jgi:hypothetical protein